MNFKFWSRGYDAGESSHVRSDLGFGRVTPCDEDKMIVDDGTLELMRQKAINLRRNFGVTSGVCDRIASFAIGSTGLRPQALTSNDKWNSMAEDWWNYIYSPECDARGRISMWQMQWQAVSLRPVMGGVYWHILSNGKVRPIEPERIRNPKNITDQAGVTDGVKVNPVTGEILGYWVHERDKDGGFSGAHAERFVEAANIIPVIRPPWRPDQIREVPDFGAIIPHLSDISDANKHTLNTLKNQSKMFGWLQTNGGNVPLPRGSDRSVGERKRFKLDSLEVVTLNNNETMNMSASPTPSSTHVPYMQMQYGLASGGIDYPYEFFTLDFTKCDYSRMKAVLLLVNKASRNWQSWLAEPLTRLWNWRIAMAIHNGDLPPAPMGADGKSEWRLIDWQAPEELWIDRQELIQADMLEYQMRQTSMSQCARRRGKDYSDILRQQARDYKTEEQIAEEEGLEPDALHPKAQIPGQTETPTRKQAADDASRKPAQKDDSNE